MVTADGAEPDELLRLAAAVEQDAEHPVARAIVESARERGLEIPAATGFEVVERRVHPEAGRRYSLIRCALETGRQHQIRVHLAAKGLPLVGDKLYGPDDELFARGVDGELTDEDRQALELDRHALHAPPASGVMPSRFFSAGKFVVRSWDVSRTARRSS